MFLILEGAARVSVHMSNGEVRDVAVLVSGDIVGEMSLMTGAPRTAWVTTISAMRVLEVTKESIESLLAAEPGLRARILEAAVVLARAARYDNLGTFEFLVDDQSPDLPVVFICGTGARSGESYDMVKLLAPDVQASFIDAQIKFAADGSYTGADK